MPACESLWRDGGGATVRSYGNPIGEVSASRIDTAVVSIDKFSAMTNAPIWGEGETPSLPTLDRDLDADVCVVGLGGSGLACVRELLAGGRRVVGIDAATVAGGVAGRNGGFLLGGLAMFHHDAVTRLGRAPAVSIYEQTLNQIDRMTAETPEAIRRVPILEQVRPRVWAVGAYSGTGNVIGALCGRAVAEIITRGRSDIADLLRA